MAKRSTATVTETEPTEAPNPTEENVTATLEAPVEEAAATTETEPVKAEKAEVDLSPLTNALDSILANLPSDLSTVDFTPVTEVYASFDATGKRATGRYLSARAESLVMEGNFDAGRACLLANNAIKEAKPGKSTAVKAPVDPTEEFVSRLTAFQVAFALTDSNKPEGIANDYLERVKSEFQTAYDQAVALTKFNAENSEGEPPVVSHAAALAVKVTSGGRSGGPRKPYGPRHDAGKHVAEVMATVEPGTFLTVSQIANGESEEYGGPATVSAIQQRLKGKTALPNGLQIETREGKLGVVRV